MDTFSAIIGSVLVAILTLLGNFIIQNFIEKEKYRNEYKKLLMNRKISVCEKGISFLQNFTKVDVHGECFAWMLEESEILKVMKTMENFNLDLAWFPPIIRSEFIDLFNAINQAHSQYKSKEKRIAEENDYIEERKALASKMRDISNRLEPAIYTYLMDVDGIDFMIRKGALRYTSYKRKGA